MKAPCPVPRVFHPDPRESWGRKSYQVKGTDVLRLVRNCFGVFVRAVALTAHYERFPRAPLPPQSQRAPEDTGSPAGIGSFSVLSVPHSPQVDLVWDQLCALGHSRTF